MVGQATVYAKGIGRRCKKDVVVAHMEPAMKRVRVIGYN